MKTMCFEVGQLLRRKNNHGHIAIIVGVCDILGFWAYNLYWFDIAKFVEWDYFDVLKELEPL